MALKALSGLDAGFLYIETPETLMHVGSLCSFERPADVLRSNSSGTLVPATSV